MVPRIPTVEATAECTRVCVIGREAVNNRHYIFRASPLLHQDLEPDALSLDDDPPLLDFEHAERRDDVPLRN